MKSKLVRQSNIKVRLRQWHVFLFRSATQQQNAAELLSLWFLNVHWAAIIWVNESSFAKPQSANFGALGAQNSLHEQDMTIPEIPGRAFLDTSAVNFLLNYGEQIHDGAPYPENLSKRAIDDIEAFRCIFLTGQRASWQLAISPYTYKEVISTNDPSRRYHLQGWFFEIWHYWRGIIEQNNDLPTFLEAERIRVELLASGVLDNLPDIEDRILICDAIVYRCDCFCTRDWKSILKYRDALISLPIKVITPTEWWVLIEPYAGIWA